MKTKRRIILFLVMVMILTLIFPFEEPLCAAEKWVVEVKTAKELNQALGGKNKVSGKKVILKSDVNVRTTIVLKGNANLILDMNGKTIGKDKDTSHSAYWGAVFAVTDHAVFTLRGKGNIRPSRNQDDERYPSFYMPAGTLKVEGSIKDYGGIRTSGRVILKKGTFYEKMISEGAEITVDGGTVCDGIVHSDPWSSCKIAVKSGCIGTLDGHAQVEISGGLVDGDIHLKSGEVTITGGMVNGSITCNRFEMRGGTIYSNGETAVSAAGRGVGGTTDTIYIPTARMTGGTIITTQKGAAGIRMKDAKFVISGGTIMNTSGQGSCGIRVDNTDSNTWREDQVLDSSSNPLSKNIVYWKAVDGKTLFVSGFQTGFQRTGDTKSCIYTPVCVVKLPSEKRIYAKEESMPQEIEGDFTMTGIGQTNDTK